MDQKELEIQRALGTLNSYWIEIKFSRREEPKGLDRLAAEIFPSATRFYNGEGSIFTIEAAESHLKLFVNALTKLIQRTSHNIGHLTWVYVYEIVNGEKVHLYNYMIK